MICRRWMVALFVAVGLLVCTQSMVSARTIRVKLNGAEVGDGATWASALRSLSDALDAAESGDEIWVGMGRYTGPFTIKAGVSVYGGFSGFEESRAQRNWLANETWLCGDGRRGVVVFEPGCGRDTVLDGVAVWGGSAEFGGGILCDGASPTIVSCFLTENQAQYGGGIYCRNASPLVRDCLFSNNAAANGGAVCCENSSPTIEDCHILGNYSNWGASAIDSVASSPSISRCVVVANPAPDDSAAIWFAEGSAGSVTSCIVSGSAGNMNLTGGSGIICTDGSSPLITRSLVVLCSGAGIYSWQSSPVIASNFVSANNSSGIIAAGGDPAVLSNTSIYNGMSGVYVYAAAPAVANNIFAFNMEAGVYAEDAAPALTHNCLFWNMEDDYIGLAPGPGDFVEDPMLDLTSAGSPKLLPGSPCIDAGDNAAAEQVLKDFDGDARVRAGRVDIGADETRPFGPGYEPVIIRVSPEGDDAGDGLSWESAKRTVQAALDAAEPTGGQVWVRGGVYTERVTLPPGVDLLGGFVGTESSASQRDWRLNETTLDGMSGGPVITVDSGYRESAIDGFTITNGESRRGAGIECTSGSPGRIANCLIAGNSGAGIYCSLDAPAQITGNTIIRNAGEGVHLTTGAVLIERNEISGNGGTGISGSADADIRLNNIRNNRAAEGAGGASLSGTVTVAGNVFADNSGPDGCLVLSGAQGEAVCNTIALNSGPGLVVRGGTIVCANNIIAFCESGVRVESAPGLTFVYNCVFGNAQYAYSGMSDPNGTGGNIAVNPLFADMQARNLHILPESPCRDAGAGTAVSGLETDIDGEPRIQDRHVDIGADESNSGFVKPVPVVIRVAVDGDDAADGLSWESAKRTMQAAIDACSEHTGEVWAKAGTYAESVSIPPYVRVFGGFDGSEARLEERDWRVNVTSLEGPEDPAVAFEGAGSGVNALDGFTVSGGILCRNASPEIANNRITGAGQGIACFGASPVIRNNAIFGNPYAGVLCANGSKPPIHDNVISANGGGGVVCQDSSPDIINNTIVGNDGEGGGGIACLGTSRPKAANNIVCFGSYGILCDGAWQPNPRNNCVYGNRVADYHGMSPGQSDISMDPLLVSWEFGDVHTLAFSPCRNAGDNASCSALWLDMDGEPRIQQGTVDIGADESKSSPAQYNPRVIRVSPDGADTNDGSSWAEPMATIQGAVNALRSTGGEVWVARGEYNERITLSPMVYLYGGFGGVETSRDQRDWRANQTVIDAGGAGRAVSVAGAGNGLSAVDGFTIRGGNASSGGGVYLYASSARIQNNTISGNTASYGGALYSAGGSPLISDNTISGNSARNGGGIYCASGRPVIRRNEVSANEAEREGGGFWTLSQAEISENRIHSNTALIAGGMRSAGKEQVIRNDIGGNTGRARAGGLEIISSGTYAGNIIRGNQALPGGSGGGILSYVGNPAITANTIVGNSAGDGGAVYFNPGGSARMQNNIVAFNSSGLYRQPEGVEVELSHNCFWQNGPYDYRNLEPGQCDVKADPQFVDTPGGDYHLLSTSACINAGSNSAAGLPSRDIDGGRRIIAGLADLGADEFLAPPASDDRDGQSVALRGFPVTAVFDGFFYVESDDQSWGIRVVHSDGDVSPGTRVDVDGILHSSEDGERFIAASKVLGVGEGSVNAVGMAGAVLGGGDWNYDPATGQGRRGVRGGEGLNSVGLLVRVWGRVEHVNASEGWFVLSDGSRRAGGAPVQDTDGNKGVRVESPGRVPPQVGDFLIIEGVCSVYERAGSLYPVILER